MYNGRVWHTWSDHEGWKPLDRNELVESIIDGLRGTLKSLAEVCEDHNIDEDELNINELDEIDQNVFCCDGCGWWYETGEEEWIDTIRYCRHCADDF